MVIGFVDVEFDEGIDAIIDAHSAFEDLLRVQRRKVEAQVRQARKVVDFLLTFARRCLLVGRMRRISNAIIDFLFTAVVLLIHRYQIWLAANGNDVLVEDVQQRVGVDGRIGVEKIAVGFLGFQISHRTGLQRILIRKHVHLVVLQRRRVCRIRLLIEVILQVVVHHSAFLRRSDLQRKFAVVVVQHVFGVFVTFRALYIVLSSRVSLDDVVVDERNHAGVGRCFAYHRE